MIKRTGADEDCDGNGDDGGNDDGGDASNGWRIFYSITFPQQKFDVHAQNV